MVAVSVDQPCSPSHPTLALHVVQFHVQRVNRVPRLTCRNEQRIARRKGQVVHPVAHAAREPKLAADDLLEAPAACLSVSDLRFTARSQVARSESSVQTGRVNSTSSTSERRLLLVKSSVALKDERIRDLVDEITAPLRPQPGRVHPGSSANSLQEFPSRLHPLRRHS